MAAVKSIKARDMLATACSRKEKIAASKYQGRAYRSSDSTGDANALLKKAIFDKAAVCDQSKILATLSCLKKSNKGKKYRDFFSHLSREVKAISKVPYERHKLSPTEILKICLVANKALDKAVQNMEIAYVRGKEHDLSRSIVIDGKRGAFVILSKKHGLLKASGTFKRVTDAVEVATANKVTARRVVSLRNKLHRTIDSTEIGYQEKYGKILTLHRGKPKNELANEKTTIIEEAYDHDLYTFTNYTSTSKRKKLPFDELLIILSSIAKTIETMHKDGIVHQDVKVKNVLYKKDENGTVTGKLIDFGHSYRPSQTRSTSTSVGHHYGTVRYSPPELLNTSAQLPTIFEQRKAEDMYAIGCLIYELFYQRPLPWDDDLYAALKDSALKKTRGKTALTTHQQEVQAVLASSQTDPKNAEKRLEKLCSKLLNANPAHRPNIAEFQTSLMKIMVQHKNSP